MGLRYHLDPGDLGHRANANLFNCWQRIGRETLPSEVPRRAVLVSSLSHPENPRGIRHANVNRVHQLHAAAAFYPETKHENTQPQAQIPRDKIHHHRRSVILPVLDAKPRRHLVECVGQTQRCQLGQSLLHSAHVRVPADRLSGAHQQLPEPHYLLSDEERVQKQTQRSASSRIVILE